MQLLLQPVWGPAKSAWLRLAPKAITRYSPCRAGSTQIDIDAQGFKHFSRSPIEVTVNQEARVDVQMQIGEQNQQVTVTGAPPIMQTDSASLGQVIGGNAVTTLPLNGRNVLNLVALVPGVVPQGGASTNLSGQNVFAAGNYQIGGGASNQGSVLVDGASVNTLYGNAVELVIDQDSVQEFNVQTHNNTAEFGNYNGGVINMSTKSGTNQFHGSAYEYVRNTIFDANDFFANRSGKGRQSWHQNQFGANLGGPICKQQGVLLRCLPRVPADQWPAGSGHCPHCGGVDRRLLCNCRPDLRPPHHLRYSGNPACTAAQPMEPHRRHIPYGNVIPPGRLSQVAKNLIKFPIFGKPNVTNPSVTSDGPVNNFFKLATAGGTNDQYTVRSDQSSELKAELCLSATPAGTR